MSHIFFCFIQRAGLCACVCVLVNATYREPLSQFLPTKGGYLWKARAYTQSSLFAGLLCSTSSILRYGVN